MINTKIAKEVAYSILIFLLFWVLLELLARFVVFVTKGPASVRRDVISDREFGWAHPVQAKKKIRTNRCGETVVRIPSKHKLINKFPMYSTGKKILFIGDSFTHAHEVSSGRAYYDIFEEKIGGNYSVYAAGIGGFGNLQEFMVLDSVYSEIRPDIVIWQLSGNDVANNVYELDNSSLNNNQRPRPYYNLITDTIEIKNPGFWLFDLSLVANFVYLKLVMLDSIYRLNITNYLDSFIALNSNETKKYREKGIEILSRLLKKAKEKYPNIIIYGFSVDSQYEKEYEKVFHKNGAKYFSQFYNHVNKIEGTNCAPLDAHWNHLGNVAAGEALSKLITEDEKSKN